LARSVATHDLLGALQDEILTSGLKMTESSGVCSPNVVCVLGMHRSGTSALCGALDLLGVDFGRFLMPATDANKKGHWEHEEIVRIHDRLLSALGSCWDDDQPLPADWLERETTREARSKLTELLERDFAQSSIFGLKDPRMCRLVPLWLPIFQTLRIEPSFILVVRHPWEVAESLAKRDGIEHPKSHLLWLEHVVQAESATRGHTRSFVRYEEIMDEPVAILGELREQLGVNLRTPSEVETSLRQFLDPSLRHHQSPEKAADRPTQPVSQLALDFYETIRNEATSNEITGKLKPLAARFRRERELFYPRSVRTEKLLPEEVSRISLTVSDPQREMRASALSWLDAELTNRANKTLSSLAPCPVRLSYHWIEKTTRRMVIFEGARSGLSPALDPGATKRYPMKIVAPSQPGEYILQITIVQENVCWFEDIRPGIVQEFAVSVMPATDHPAGSSSQEASMLSDSASIEQRLRAGVTIGVPIYRGKPFLEESLASVRNQTLPEIEVIMSLDGPDPDCEEICQKFLPDSRFRLVVQPQRLGWMRHTNWVMSQVQTEFWHLHEQDDVIEPTFLETLMRSAVEHPNAAAVFSDLRTFGTMDTHMEMSSVIGSPVMRQLKLIYEHFPGVAPLGLVRTQALRLSGGLQANEFENFAADTALMAGLARWGELHRLPLELYRKRVHVESTHATWWDWPMERRFKAWQVHCLDMLHQALMIDATPQDGRLLWLAIIERLVSPRTASYFLPVTDLTAAERADMLDSFLARARTSSIDIPGSLEASWDEIEKWTRGFCWIC
jgi:hypothetical protein